MTYFKNNNQKFFWCIFTFSFFLITSIFFLHPLHQDLLYHNFADQRYLTIIPHWGDVLTNLSFAIVGLLLFLQYRKNLECYNGQHIVFNCFCFACFSLFLGSGYYHWTPNNFGLFLDRFTMLLGFALILLDTCIRYNIFSPKNIIFKIITIELLFLITLLPWLFFDRLELYVFAQFFVMSVMPLLAIKNWLEGGNQYKHIFLMFLFYSLAKFFEFYDSFFYQLFQFSGHSIKHICYALSLYYFGKDILVIERPIHQ